jgi:hypothetical protein
MVPASSRVADLVAIACWAGGRAWPWSGSAGPRAAGFWPAATAVLKGAAPKLPITPAAGGQGGRAGRGCVVLQDQAGVMEARHRIHEAEAQPAPRRAAPLQAYDALQHPLRRRDAGGRCRRRQAAAAHRARRATAPPARRACMVVTGHYWKNLFALLADHRVVLPNPLRSRRLQEQDLPRARPTASTPSATPGSPGRSAPRRPGSGTCWPSACSTRQRQSSLWIGNDMQVAISDSC